ncbi:MAG: hypothetical protein ABIP48_11650, partial [Planctomycetota bacterium]
TAQEHLPGEFCADLTSGAFSPGVRLNQATPQGDPVWRMLIAEPDGDPDADPLTFEATQRNDPDEPTSDPRFQPTIERSVYFIPPSGPYDDGALVLRYYSSSPNLTPVMPGRYAVIGPADAAGAASGTTYLGFRLDDPERDGSPAPRRIELTPNAVPPALQVAVYANDVTQPDVQSIPVAAQPAVAVVIDRTVAGPQLNRTEPRFSVSEPTNGYPVYNDTVNNQFNPPRDIPLDDPASPDSGVTELWDHRYPGNRESKGIMYEGTSRRFRVIYLQRLANPLAPWNVRYNPYRTVDSMQVDLTAFNGMVVADDPILDMTIASSEFYTFQRGYNSTQQAAQQRQNIWADELETDADTIPLPTRGVHAIVPPTLPSRPAHFFSETFAHTLGRLNAWFGDPRSGVYLGDPDDNPANPNDGPFPWLTWLNRPFVNRMELMLVPDKRSSQLLRNFTIGQEANDPYAPAAVDPPGPTGDLSFQHLRPFFGTFGQGGGAPNPPSRLYRVLDFVHVPSRFVGTEVQANPGIFANWGLNPATPLVPPPFSFPFRPPFNGISRYREPGRVNINTIFSRDVWNGLLNYFPTMTGASLGAVPTDYWDEMVDARQGYFGPNLEPRLPTQFAIPFRSFAGSNLVPLPLLEQIHGMGEGIHATLLRWDPGGQPLFRHESTDPAEQTARNPYFRYQLLERLGGLTTTRSNVYAVWITVGYFEVEQAPPMPANWTLAQYQAVYPDGYQLGQELGSDTGEIKRHRAFYLFDRSIPVGFERGRDINVNKAILLERFIE